MENKQEWHSPQKIAEEQRLYLHKRFEDYMQLVDDGTLERGLAIIALREELEYERSYEI